MKITESENLSSKSSSPDLILHNLSLQSSPPEMTKTNFFLRGDKDEMKFFSKESSDLLCGCKLEPELQSSYLNQLDKTLTAFNKDEETL